MTDTAVEPPKKNKGGRPLGSKNKPSSKRTRMTASARATAMMDALLDKAHAAIEENLGPTKQVVELDEHGNPMVDDDGAYIVQSIGGNAQVAQYVIDRVWPKKGAVLPKHIGVDITTIQGVIECATVATHMVLRQEMSLTDAKDLMDHLLRYCQLRAFDHIEELRDLIGAFEQQGAGKLTDKMDPTLIPQWGKLSEGTKTANETPAE